MTAAIDHCRYGEGDDHAVERVAEDALQGQLDGREVNLAHGLDDCLVGLILFQQLHDLVDRAGHEVGGHHVAEVVVVGQRDDQGGEEVDPNAQHPSAPEVEAGYIHNPIDIDHAVEDVGHREGETPVEPQQEGVLRAEHIK